MLANTGWPEAKQAEYRREIFGFLHLCKVRRVPATIMLVKDYLAECARQGPNAARGPLRCFFGKRRRRRLDGWRPAGCHRGVNGDGGRRASGWWRVFFRNAAGAPRPQGQSPARPAMSGLSVECGGDEPKLPPRFRPLAKFISGSIARDRTH